MVKQPLKISPEDKAKIEALKNADKGVEVDPEWLAVAELGKHYGWAAIESVLDGSLQSETMAVLLEAGRRVDARYYYQMHRASFIGTGAANSKKPGATFNKATKDIVSKLKADT